MISDSITKTEKIPVKEFERKFFEIDGDIDEDDDLYYDVLDSAKEYLVEYMDKGYSWDNIGDDTTITVKNGNIIVSVEVYL